MRDAPRLSNSALFPSPATTATTAVSASGTDWSSRSSHAREERLLQSVPDAETAVVAVVAGEGNRALFESLGASRIVEGGQTMNPSTAELVAAIDAAPGKAVLVLPNN